MKHPATPEQQAIFDCVRSTNDNLVVEAAAGSGKTTTALEALTMIPQRSILMTAFNKPIADTLQARMPKLPRTHAVHVKTFHSLGFGMVRNRRPNIIVSKDGTEEIVNRALGGRAVNFKQRRWITRLLKIAKETLIEDPDPEELVALGFEREIFDSRAREADIEEVVERTLDCWDVSKDIDKLEVIDFCDQVWLPSVCQLEPTSRYQAVVIDELQDISAPQLALIRRVMLANTRVIAIGDRNQAIYDWRGALGAKAWEIMQDDFNARTLPLSTTFRCSLAVVAEANQLVPELKARDGADDGSVSEISITELTSYFLGGVHDETHTFVLSRRNDDLLDCAMHLYRERVQFQLAGARDMLSPLFDLIDNTLDMRSAELFSESVSVWYKKEKEKAEKNGQVSRAERAYEYQAMLHRCLHETGGKPTRIKGLLHAIMVPNKSGVMLSTVHRMKGLEADRVFLLKQSFARHRNVEAFVAGKTQSIPGGAIPKPKRAVVGTTTIGLPDGKQITLEDWVDDKFYETVSFGGYDLEELNIEYVAITRARQHLVWVNLDRHRQPEITELIDLDDTTAVLTELGDEMLRKSTVAELEIMLARAEREAQRQGVEEDAAVAWMNYADKVRDEIARRP